MKAWTQCSDLRFPAVSGLGTRCSRGPRNHTELSANFLNKTRRGQNSVSQDSQTPREKYLRLRASEHQPLGVVPQLPHPFPGDVRPVWVGTTRSHLLLGSWICSRLTLGLTAFYEWPTEDPAMVDLQSCRKQWVLEKLVTLLGITGAESQDCPRGEQWIYWWGIILVQLKAERLDNTWWRFYVVL